MNRQIFAILEGLHDKVGEFHYMQPTGKLVRNKEDQISEKIQILKKLLNAKKKDEEVEVPKDLEYIDTPSESNHLAAFLVKMKEVVAEINKVFDLVKEVMSSETTANGVIEESFQDLCKLHRTLVIINKCFYYEHRDSYEKSGLQKKLAAKYEKLKNEIAVLESYL